MNEKKKKKRNMELQKKKKSFCDFINLVIELFLWENICLNFKYFDKFSVYWSIVIKLLPNLQTYHFA